MLVYFAPHAPDTRCFKGYVTKEMFTLQRDRMAQMSQAQELLVTVQQDATSLWNCKPAVPQAYQSCLTAGVHIHNDVKRNQDEHFIRQ